MNEEQDRLLETNQHTTRRATHCDAVRPFLATRSDRDELRLNVSASTSVCLAMAFAIGGVYAAIPFR